MTSRRRLYDGLYDLPPSESRTLAIVVMRSRYLVSLVLIGMSIGWAAAIFGPFVLVSALCILVAGISLGFLGALDFVDAFLHPLGPER